MARFRIKRTHPRITGTKKKHGHDSLHLVETARVKVNKARVRLPDTISPDDWKALADGIADLHRDVVSLGLEAARKGSRNNRKT